MSTSESPESSPPSFRERITHSRWWRRILGALIIGILGSVIAYYFTGGQIIAYLINLTQYGKQITANLPKSSLPWIITSIAFPLASIEDFTSVPSNRVACPE